MNGVIQRAEALTSRCQWLCEAHKASAVRLQRVHIRLGIPVMILNLVIGSSLFAMAESHSHPAVYKAIGGALALTAAVLSGVQTFFRFPETLAGHRLASHQYAAAGQRVQRLLHKLRDEVIQRDVFVAEFDKIEDEVHEFDREHRDLVFEPDDEEVADYKTGKTTLRYREGGPGERELAKV